SKKPSGKPTFKLRHLGWHLIRQETKTPQDHNPGCGVPKRAARLGWLNVNWLNRYTPGADRTAKPSSTRAQLPRPASGPDKPVTRASSPRSVIPAPARYARAISSSARSRLNVVFSSF